MRNDWPLVKGMYVPFLDMSLNLLLQGQSHNHNLTAGESIRWFVPEKLSSQAFALAHPKVRCRSFISVIRCRGSVGDLVKPRCS